MDKDSRKVRRPVKTIRWFPLHEGLGFVIGVPLGIICLPRIGIRIHVGLFSWQFVVILALAGTAELVLRKYYKIRTIRDEMVRSIVIGIIWGIGVAAAAFIF